ncbi:alcohol oxidase [Fomitopsis serialis]|uniref:alcohol oxidase n=1 Tax=Fomitopsis serialis TaxID=139415 RepID=UPI0020077B96|nr:alcohol oxidase [Neoantrodia serialis]KAH9915856.1 alcohol oxidase [Neoantrodia serialis]
MLAQITDVSGKEFDYIIVGGGTAGLVVAARLTEDPSVRVLVLEAGEANLDDPMTLIPMQAVRLFSNLKYDWAYKTVKQPHSNNREYVWSRGKGLGGSSAINFMFWNKPARQYLDMFEELGVEGWDWDTFHRYVKKTEKFTPPSYDMEFLTYDAAHMGSSGPIDVSFSPARTHLEELLMDAFAQHGIPRVTDTAAGITTGTSVSPAILNPQTFHRSYSANAYYQPNAHRQNLTVLVTAHVTGIASRRNDDGTVTATGVAFVYGDSVHEAKASNEVLLAAGAVISPQILELSGIGRRDVLEEAGVEVKVDLPGVGENIQEHLWFGLVCQVKEQEVNGHEIETCDPLFFPELAAEHHRLRPEGKGALNLRTVNLTFVPLQSICPDADEMQSTLSSTILAGVTENKYPPGLRKQYELQLKHLKNQLPSMEIMLLPTPIVPVPTIHPERKHISLCFGMNSPFSRGTIHIASKDPMEHPTIDPHIFEEPYDLQTMVESVKFNRKLIQTEPFKSVIREEVYPGKDVQTDEQISEWLRDNVRTTYHTTSSCSMLPKEDGGVVDSRLKVYGTTNIRVVDLSVVPVQIGSHTQAMVYAIAEQAADIIKGAI